MKPPLSETDRRRIAWWIVNHRGYLVPKEISDDELIAAFFRETNQQDRIEI